MEDKKGQMENFAFGMTVLIVGLFFLLTWVWGEFTNHDFFLRAGQWGLGLLLIVIEMIKSLLRGGYLK